MHSFYFYFLVDSRPHTNEPYEQAPYLHPLEQPIVTQAFATTILLSYSRCQRYFSVIPATTNLL